MKEIDIALLMNKREKINFDLYVKIGQKFIKYADKSFQNSDLLEKLSAKGAYSLFIQDEDYSNYIKSVHLVCKQIDPVYTESVVLEITENRQNLLDMYSSMGGFSSQQVEVVQKMSKQAISRLGKIGAENFQDTLSQFSKFEDPVILKKEIVSFIGSMLMKDNDVKPNIINMFLTGITICDLNLTSDEYWESFTQTKNPKIIKHGEALVNTLPKVQELSSPMLIHFIKHHHEEPNGTGYPDKIDCGNFNVLTCYYKVAESLSAKLLSTNFKSMYFEQHISATINEYQKYVGTKFDEITLSLVKLKKHPGRLGK